MNKEQLNQIEKDMNELQADYKYKKNLKFKNIDLDNLFTRKDKLYEMNKFIDLHCEQMMYYNQRRIEKLKIMYESDEIDKELLVNLLKQIHKSNEFIGEKCYVDRIEVLRKIYEVELEIEKIDTTSSLQSFSQ